MYIRQCTRDDLEELIRIGRETYYDAFHSLNRAETMDAYLNESFDREKIKAELAEPASRFYFCFTDSEAALPSGYFKINFPSAQTDLNEPGSVELERIYVRAEYQGNGIGAGIMSHVESIARTSGASRIWLGVWEKNTAAISFYKKSGFVITGNHSFVMGNEVQDDYIMTRKLI